MLESESRNCNNTTAKVRLVLMVGAKSAMGNPKGKAVDKGVDAIVQPLLAANLMRTPGGPRTLSCLMQQLVRWILGFVWRAMSSLVLDNDQAVVRQRYNQLSSTDVSAIDPENTSFKLSCDYILAKHADPHFQASYGSNDDKWATISVVPADKLPTYITELDKTLITAVATTASKRLEVALDNTFSSKLERSYTHSSHAPDACTSCTTLLQASLYRNKGNVMRSSRDAAKDRIPPGWYRAGTPSFFEKHARTIISAGQAVGMVVPNGVREAPQVCPVVHACSCCMDRWRAQSRLSQSAFQY